MNFEISLSLSGIPLQGIDFLLFFLINVIIYLATPGLSCSTQDLEFQHVGPSSLTRN